LAELAGEVYTVEVRPALLARARETLGRLGYANVRFRLGDGALGWPEAAPFDRILVTACAPEIPPALVEQLAVGGRMVLPVGAVEQTLWTVTRLAGRDAEGRPLTDRQPGTAVRFVPMRPGGEADPG